MPRGIYNRKQVTVKKKAAKKAAKKTARKVAVLGSEQTPEVKRQPTIKEQIIDTLKKRHIEFTDMDGHIAINTAQMIDSSALLDLLGDGVQAMNTRMSKHGAYIALYY